MHGQLLCIIVVPGVASFIRGASYSKMDREPNYSMYGEIANFDISKIEEPALVDRQTWLERISDEPRNLTN